MAETKKTTTAKAETTEVKETKVVKAVEEPAVKQGIVAKVKAKMPTKDELKAKAKEFGKKALKTGLVFAAGFATKAICDKVSQVSVDDEIEDNDECENCELLSDTAEVTVIDL